MSEEHYAYFRKYNELRHKLLMNLFDEIILCNRQLDTSAVIRGHLLMAFVLVTAGGLFSLIGQLVAVTWMVWAGRLVGSLCVAVAGWHLGRTRKGMDRLWAQEGERDVLRKARNSLIPPPPPPWEPEREGRAACH